MSGVPDEKRRVPPGAEFEVTISQDSFRPHNMDRKERQRSGYDLTIHRRNSHSSFTQTGMKRAEIAFLIERLQAFMEDTARDNNWVYQMDCGHEYDSAYRLTRRSRGSCSQHGFTRLTEGDFLPSWIVWARSMIGLANDARDEMFRRG
jgi:hypothetical protein